MRTNSVIHKLTLIMFGIIFTPSFALAFPEMVRHGYVNCTSCHVSPTGGGVLSPYGREISRQLLSSWGKDNEDEFRFAYGLIKPPSWLDVMGLYRGAPVYIRTPFNEQWVYIFMQNDLEAAVHWEKWSFVGTIGYQNRSTDVTFLDHITSKRHYLMFRPKDELSFRAGRFFPSFGLNTPDHIIPTKRNVGWDENQESYNVETAWLADNWNLYLTANLGRPDQPSLNREVGAILNSSIAVADQNKLGLSYLYGFTNTRSRHLTGPWGIIGFTRDFFLLTEWDFQFQLDKTGATPNKSGFVNYQRLDYELAQGFHLYLTQDFSQVDFSNTQTLTNSFGLGTQFFPRPHFEINISWKKIRSLALTPDYYDFGWFLLNFYL